MYTHGRAIAAALLGLLGGCITSEDRDALAVLRARHIGDRDREVLGILGVREPAFDGPDPLDPELSREVRADHVEEAVVRRNPDARAALERWAESIERVPQVWLSDPRATYRYSSMFRMHTAELMQEVPFPAKLRAEARAAASEARAARAGVDAAVNILRERARVAVASLHVARRALELFDASLSQLERFVELARTKYTTGAVPQSDVLRVELEREGLRATREELVRDEAIAASALNLLLARRPDAPLGAIAPIASPTEPAPLPALLQRAEGSHPDLDAAAWRREASDAVRSRAGLEWFPDLAFSAAYVRDFEEDDDEVEASFGLSLPVWLWKTRARQREAEAGRRRAEAEWVATRNRILDEVAQAESRLRAALARARILRELALPTAERSVGVTEAAYVSGTLDLLPVIDARRQLLAQQLELVRVEGEAIAAEAGLVRATGGVDAAKEAAR